MKRLFKLFLILCIPLVGLYAAIPWWLPVIVATQLPTGWQLQEMKVGYPDFSGINIHKLDIKGELQQAELELVSSDTRFNYQRHETEIGSLTIHAYMRSGENVDQNALTLDDLSLPVTRLTGNIPGLSIDQFKLLVHPAFGSEPGAGPAKPPLVFNFHTLQLTPLQDNSFHINSVIDIENSPAVNGQLLIDASDNSLSAALRFPADSDTPPWLNISLQQLDQVKPQARTTTTLQATLDTDATDQQWLADIFERFSDGMLTRVSGQLEISAMFAGTELQSIEQLTLSSANLQAEIAGGTLSLDTEWLAKREAATIVITQARATSVGYLDLAGNLDLLLTRSIPNLHRVHHVETMLNLEIDPSSELIIQPDMDPLLVFNGEIRAGINSAGSNFDIHSNDLMIRLSDFSRPEAASINGSFQLNWGESTAISFTVDEGEPDSMTLSADGLDIHTQLSLNDGAVISTGKGRFTAALIKQPTTSMNEIELSWQDLDLLGMTGVVSSKTQGFSTEFDGETWTGFDFDSTFSLLGNDDIKGIGSMAFDDGPDLPYEFTGNIQSNRWNITLPDSTIKLTELGSILRAANYQLPESIKFTDGNIDISGKIAVGDEITAVMSISGHELAASMLETHVREAGFGFSSRYGKAISVDGPVFISALTLAGDIDIWNINADLMIENTEKFALKNLHAEVFDGQLSLGSLRFADGQIEDTTIEIQHINLGRLLAYADIDGLEGTGELDISLPTGSDQTGIYVKNGTFNSNGPGRLAYTKEGVAGTNIGLQALENFQYKDLSGTVNYESNGTYVVGIRLEGKNPDLYGGHPVVFNLNINGLLPELFESLFITGDFDESILKQIRTD